MVRFFTFIGFLFFSFILIYLKILCVLEITMIVFYHSCSFRTGWGRTGPLNNRIQRHHLRYRSYRSLYILVVHYENKTPIHPLVYLYDKRLWCVTAHFYNNFPTTLLVCHLYNLRGLF